MKVKAFSVTLALLAFGQISLLGQVPFAAASSPSLQMPHLAEAPVPADPLELVTGDAQPIQDVSQRADLIALIINAHRNRNVRAYPYDLKTTFTAFGSSASDGSWQLEDTAPGAGLYRWTAQGPSYSVVNLYRNRVLYSNQAPSSVPLRLAEVRSAIFFVQSALGPRASLRTASGELNGSAVVCALVSHAPMAKGATGGRRWEEAEYCIDPKSGNLVTYSPVLGYYVLYDYSQALHFHDKTIPNKFTITHAGHTVIEAQIDSITDPAQDPSGFQPSALNEIGVGPIMTPAWRYRTMISSAALGVNGALQMVVVHGMQSPDGHLTDVELIASTSASLTSSAFDYVAGWQGRSTSEDSEPGATLQSHEVFLTLEYTNSRR